MDGHVDGFLQQSFNSPYAFLLFKSTEKFMKKLILSIAAILLMSPAISHAEAGEEIILLRGEAKKQILRLIESTPSEYCDVDSKDIRIIHSEGQVYVFYFTFGRYVPDYKEYDTEPCSSGTRTGMQHLAKLEKINGKFRIGDSKPLEYISLNFRFIDTESMLVDNGVWTFLSREHGKDESGMADSNCCPKDTYINRIRLSDMKILNRKFIGRELY